MTTSSVIDDAEDIDGSAVPGAPEAPPVAVDGPVPDVAPVPDAEVETPETPVVETMPQPADPAPAAPEVTEPEVAAPEPSAPETPVKVDGPVPDPGVPATPVEVDGPVPDAEPNTDPTPVVAEPSPTPVKVDGPKPDTTTAENPKPAVPSEVEPSRPDEGDSTKTAEAEKPRRTATKPKPVVVENRNPVPTLLRGLLGLGQGAAVAGSSSGGSRDRIDAREASTTAEATETETVTASTPAAEAAPEPDEAPAQVQAAREPAEARSAPRIALSSGEGADVYQRREISALGMTAADRQTVGALGFKVISERRSPLLGNRVLTKLRTPANQTAEAALKRVSALLPQVTFEFQHLYRPSGEQPVPVRYPADMIGDRAESSCNVDTRIGLIDTGVGRHPALANASITRRNFVERDAATNVAHGTAIASILVGDLPGTTPLVGGADLYSANVFVQDGSALRADAHAIINALDWMAAEGVRVVNLSLIGPPNVLLEQAVRGAAERGLVLVAAAGNQGPGSEPAYPAAYSTVIAVAAVDQRGRPYGRGNRGSYIYVAAPGVDVWGADARGGEAFWTGTSFAAPFVTAAVARDMFVGRTRDINDGRAQIAAAARDLGAPGRDPIYGYGLLQVGGCGAEQRVLSARD